MPPATKHTKTLKFTILYIALFTIYFLLPASIIQFSAYFLFDLIFNLIIYFFFSWLLLATLGRCPLRWRKVAVWVFIIAFAHVYWMEFVQNIFPSLGRQSSIFHLLTGLAGAFLGIVVRLNHAYNHCNCHLMHQNRGPAINSSVQRISEMVSQAATKSDENLVSPMSIPLTIADHPGLNKIIADALGWKPLTLYPSVDISIEMICTGKSLISLPHFSYGNVRSTKNFKSEDEVYQLLSFYALPRNIAQMEVRQAWYDISLKSSKTASWLKLENKMETQMKSFSPNLRRKISKSIRNGFKIRQGGIELLSVFWKIYARHMATLGSAALPENYYAALIQNYHLGSTAIFILYDNDKPVGAAFNMAFKGFYENDCFATLHHVQNRYASYFLHYHMIKHAIETGCHTYSFGRSTTGGGVHQFKKQWGAVDVPLLWTQYPPQKINLRKQGWLQKIWKRLPWVLRSQVNPWLAKWFY